MKLFLKIIIFNIIAGGKKYNSFGQWILYLVNSLNFFINLSNSCTNFWIFYLIMLKLLHFNSFSLLCLHIYSSYP